MTEAFERAARTRIKAIARTPEETRQALAQHLTPPEVAKLAVDLFSATDEDIVPVGCLCPREALLGEGGA